MLRILFNVQVIGDYSYESIICTIKTSRLSYQQIMEYYFYRIMAELNILLISKY